MNAEDRKKHILTCAKKLFSKHGYHETQISDIIEMAGIARGTVYQYFKNKDDILINILEGTFNAWEKTIAINFKATDMSQWKAGDYLKYRIKQTLLFLANDHDMSTLVLRVSLGLQKEFETIIKRFEKKIFNIIIDDITFGQKIKNIREDVNIELMATILMGAVFRIAYHYFVLHDSKRHKLDIDKLTDDIAEIFIPGIFIPGRY